MKISIDIEIKRGNASQVDTSTGEAVLRDAVGLVEDPANTPERFERRKAWLGGAIKMFATLTGMSEAEASKKFSFTPPSTATASVPARYADLAAPGVTVEPPPGR